MQDKTTKLTSTKHFCRREAAWPTPFPMPVCNKEGTLRRRCRLTSPGLHCTPSPMPEKSPLRKKSAVPPGVYAARGGIICFFLCAGQLDKSEAHCTQDGTNPSPFRPASSTDSVLWGHLGGMKMMLFRGNETSSRMPLIRGD